MSGIQGVPGWQTEELQDEWPDSDHENEFERSNLSYGTQSVSFTVPLSTQIHTTTDFEPDTTPSGTRNHAIGTFLVREDVAHAPLLPKTPGRNKKGMVKDFFTPLPLERMFEPPSPPTSSERQIKPSDPSPLSRSINSPNTPGSSKMEDEIMETDMPNMNSFHGRKANMACQFTFSVPREASSRQGGLGAGNLPQAQSTPNPPPFVPHAAPPTDPRLRLFQFQYDTYTREHLSALVDSIAVNTPSGTGTTATPTSFSNGLSRVSEVTGTAANMSHMRSTKRLKLSPSSDLCGEGAGSRATITRPKIYGKDYVGESGSLMQQIKQARDYSTISTVASGQNNSPSTHNQTREETQELSPPELLRRPSFLSIPEQTSSNAPSMSGTITSKANSYSSSTYRQKAAALMEQIKSDVKRQKRVFSGDTDTSHVTTHVEENTNSFTRSFTGSLKISSDGKENARQSSSSTHRRSSASKSNLSRSRIASPRKSYKQTAEDAIDLAHNLSRISIHEQQPIVNITLIPPSNALPGASTTTSHHDPQPTTTNPLSTLAPPSYPSTSIRIITNEDLNRFVSSSTASGTTLTAGSVPSFTKHAGPAHIRTIAPADLPAIPERFGDMMFDKVMMKWVKSTARAMGSERSATSQTGEVSDDPFGDIESLRDDSRSDGEDHEVGQEEEDEEVPAHPAEMSIIEEQSEIEDEEELELSNFSTDASAHIVNVMTGVDTDDYNDETTDSEDENDQLHTITQAHQHQAGGGINDINDFDSEFDESSPSRMNSVNSVHSIHDIPIPSSNAGGAAATQFLSVHTHTQVVTTTFSTPNRSNVGPVANSTTPVIRSALKSNSATPTSALKNSDRRQYQTPLHRTSHHRSVSFSDGKRDGPIQGE
ncbi:hypothetical protein M413DRAFT_399220 [Hebeloma cylindrosporum]|uniref:Uncharacterized protein n=1 Tax=Hebeloma cylindrosporum TaxID=76867 RepID=A0A0C2Y067_HEBCY|nr:hypothetical protein M413DRAFT_399220 [Hebeloma cylindrosporum h7]